MNKKRHNGLMNPQFLVRKVIKIRANTIDQGLYKDKHSCRWCRLVGVFNFPILKFEDGKFATGVLFCHKGSVFGNGDGSTPKR